MTSKAKKLYIPYGKTRQKNGRYIVEWNLDRLSNLTKKELKFLLKHEEQSLRTALDNHSQSN